MVLIASSNFDNSRFETPFSKYSSACAEKDRLFAIQYGPYQNLGGDFYPSEININTTDGDSRTRIEVVYRDIDLNAQVSFPFNIPAGYEQIKLGE